MRPTLLALIPFLATGFVHAAETAPAKATAAETKAAPVVEYKEVDSVTPVPRNAVKWWPGRHELSVKRANTEPEKTKLVFVGDSITQGWEGGGKKEWAAHFAKYNALNLGFSGDKTEHVLWRLENGEWPAALKPKVVVVMIGTNNLNNPVPHPAEDTAKGVTRVIEKIRTLSPDSTIILHPIFPRGATPADKRRKSNEKTNATIAKLADGSHVRLLDVGAKFLDDKGNLPKSVMPDLLHPNAEGYKIWAETVAPEIDKLIGSAAK